MSANQGLYDKPTQLELVMTSHKIESQIPLKAYASPALKIYGSVTALTAFAGNNLKANSDNPSAAQILAGTIKTQ